jgi:hypothetical protein
MKRKEFLKSTCALGMCTCAGMSIFSSENTFAGSNSNSDDKPDWRMGFIQRRFAKFIGIVSESVNEEESIAMMEKLGRECAKENRDYYLKFKGNIGGFLEEMKKEWIENADYDKEANLIRLTGKKTDSCFCPFVDKAITPKSFCNCSAGYTKEVFETVTGRPVKVRVEKSVLRGGNSCNSLIEIS